MNGSGILQRLAQSRLRANLAGPKLNNGDGANGRAPSNGNGELTPAQRDHLATLGRIAAGVTHEINNPLAFVTANLRFLSEEAPRLQKLLEPWLTAQNDEDARGLRSQLQEFEAVVDETRDGAERMGHIVRDLRKLSRFQEGTQCEGAVDLRDVVRTAIRLAGAKAKQDVQLALDLRDAPLVAGNETQLGQVIVNLVANAIEARCEADAEHAVRVATRTDDRGWALIEVADNGEGIPGESLDRIFEPFFTTKPSGEGTGLGLAISSAIVRTLGGELRVESEPQRGTTARVLLPPLGSTTPATSL